MQDWFTIIPIGTNGSTIIPTKVHGTDNKKKWCDNEVGLQRAFRDQQLLGIAKKLSHVLTVPDRDVGPDEAAALWQLCQWQAALSGTTDQTCSLFSPEVMHAWDWLVHGMPFA